jgi:hypothetical protein
MRSRLLGYVIAFTVGYGLSGYASAQPRNRNGASKAGSDKTIDKQMEWEKRVMGDDSAKSADLRKIAAAQKLADEAAKHPPPIAAPKAKDPSKEGVRAKQEAAIGLPIASDQNSRPRKSTGGAKKAAQPSPSGNDELGALVAASLAQEKAADEPANGRGSKHQARGASASRSGDKGRAKGRPRGAKSGGDGSSPSSLDQMFATSGQ